MMKTIMLVALTGLVFPGAVIAQDSVSSSGSVTIGVSDLPPQATAYIGITSSGGTTASCPPGMMMIGLGGTRLKFISKITPICGSFTKDGSTASSAPVDPAVIGAGGAAFKLECGRARVVTKLRVAHYENTTTYPYLAAVEITCSSWALGRWMAESPQVVAMVNFESFARKASVSCTSQMQPARSLRVRAPTWVKALSIVCDEP